MIKDTNPDHYRVDGADFVEYMHDPKISGFGNWMFANGYNTGTLEARPHWCIDSLKIDAAELLKEQESGKVLHVKDRSMNETHGKTGFCPRCNQLVVWGVNRRYCGFCGKGLIWDD